METFDMKRVFMMMVGLLVLSFSLAVIGCSNNKEQKLTIRIDDKIIESVMLDDADLKDVFKKSYTRDDLMSAEFFEFDQKVYLDFNGKIPDKLVVMDNILTTEGDFMYDEKSSVSVACEKVDDGYYFNIVKHPASGFSSFHKDDRTDLRGYRVKASWGVDDVFYGFIIKTTASN